MRAPPSYPRQILGSAHSRPASGRTATRAVGAFIPTLTRKAFEKYGFSAASLVTDWESIVGRDLAACTEPERLRWPTGVAVRDDVEDDARGRPGATLVLRVDPRRALEVQYNVQQIIERINVYFGYRAVAALRIVQAPVKPLRRSERAPADVQPVPCAGLEGIADVALRDALQRMAHGIVIRKSL